MRNVVESHHASLIQSRHLILVALVVFSASFGYVIADGFRFIFLLRYAVDGLGRDWSLVDQLGLGNRDIFQVGGGGGDVGKRLENGVGGVGLETTGFL